MEIKRLNRGEAQKAMSGWIYNYPLLPDVDNDYEIIRNEIGSLFCSVKNRADEKGVKIQDYFVDEQFAILLYLYLCNQKWFSLRIASDDGFWRYLSVMVLPHLVSERWGKDNADHFWKIHRRIWLKQLWWYVYLSWNEDEKTTRGILESPNCSTDTILNFVERSGKKGTCVDVYRQIIKIYSAIPAEKLSEFNRGRKTDDLFRVIMKLNTARLMVMEPSLCSGGVKGYAEKLFRDSGIDVS